MHGLNSVGQLAQQAQDSNSMGTTTNRPRPAMARTQCIQKLQGYAIVEKEQFAGNARREARLQAEAFQQQWPWGVLWVPKVYVGFEPTPKRDVRRREFHSVGANFFLCHNRHKLLLTFVGETSKFATFKRSLVRFVLSARDVFEKPISTFAVTGSFFSSSEGEVCPN